MEKLEDYSSDEEYNYKKKDWSEERMKQEIEELKKHPLFLDDVSDLENNEHLQALQALLYDDTKEDEHEMAQVFKKQGDEIFKERLMPVLKKGDLSKIKDENLRTRYKGTRHISILCFIIIRK